MAVRDNVHAAGAPGGVAGKPRQDREVATVFRPRLSGQPRRHFVLFTMDVLILAAAKPALSYARAGVEFYCDRLRPLGHVELRYVKDGGRDEVSARLLKASEGCLRIALDERGQNLTTRQLEKQWRDWQLHSVKRVAFLIGAADGHTDALRGACERVLCLGKHTMQHELALVVLLEQIYRIHTLISGSPYHRD